MPSSPRKVRAISPDTVETHTTRQDQSHITVSRSVCRLQHRDDTANGFLCAISLPKGGRVFGLLTSASFPPEFSGIIEAIDAEFYNTETRPEKVKINLKTDVIKWFTDRFLDFTFFELSHNFFFHLIRKNFDFLPIATSPVLRHQLLTVCEFHDDQPYFCDGQARILDEFTFEHNVETKPESAGFPVFTRKGHVVIGMLKSSPLGTATISSKMMAVINERMNEQVDELLETEAVGDVSARWYKEDSLAESPRKQKPNAGGGSQTARQNSPDARKMPVARCAGRLKFRNVRANGFLCVLVLPNGGKEFGLMSNFKFLGDYLSVVDSHPNVRFEGLFYSPKRLQRVKVNVDREISEWVADQTLDFTFLALSHRLLVRLIRREFYFLPVAAKSAFRSQAISFFQFQGDIPYFCDGRIVRLLDAADGSSLEHNVPMFEDSCGFPVLDRRTMAVVAMQRAKNDEQTEMIGVATGLRRIVGFIADFLAQPPPPAKSTAQSDIEDEDSSASEQAEKNDGGESLDDAEIVVAPPIEEDTADPLNESGLIEALSKLDDQRKVQDAAINLDPEPKPMPYNEEGESDSSDDEETARLLNKPEFKPVLEVATKIPPEDPPKPKESSAKTTAVAILESAEKRRLLPSDLKAVDVLEIFQLTTVPESDIKMKISSFLKEKGLNLMDLAGFTLADFRATFQDTELRQNAFLWLRQVKFDREKQLQKVAVRLHWAAQTGNLSTVRELLSQTNLRPSDRRYIIDYTDIGFYFCTPIVEAAKNGHLAVVKFLMEKGTTDDAEAFRYAAEAGHLTIIRYFCRVRPDIVDAKNKYGETALNKSAFGGKLEVVQYLAIQKGANIENKGKNGWTPLAYAAIGGSVDVVKFLIGFGADAYAKDETQSGDQAIHLAAYYGQPEVVVYLGSLDSRLLTTKNEQSFTPKQRATAQNNHELAKLIEEEISAVQTKAADDDVKPKSVAKFSEI